MSAPTIDLQRIELESGTVLADPPVISADAEGKTVDHEATEQLQDLLRAWGEVAYRIVESGELTDSGDLAADDSKELRQAYADLPAVPGKSYARSYAAEQTQRALSDISDAEAAFRVAQMWSKISKDQKKDSPKPRAERAARPQVSATELAANKLAAMKLAVQWYESNATEVDDQVEDEFVEQADDKVSDLQDMFDAYVDWLDMEVDEGEEKPEFEETFGESVDPVVRDAAKIARQKVRRPRSGGGGGTYSGPRRNIGTHIENAFAQVEVGTFLTVSEIVNMRSEEYGDDKPSSGAVANRLFPPSGSACTVEGIEPGTDENNKQGATKIA